MSLTCEIIAYRMFRSTALAAETKTTKWRRYPSSPTKLRWSQSDLNVKTIEIVRTPKTSLRSRGISRHLADRETLKTVTHAMVRKESFINLRK